MIGIGGFSQKLPNEMRGIPLIDVRGNEFVFSDSIPKPSIILYYSEPNCHACIDVILIFLSKKRIKNFYVIAQVRNDVIYRKQVVTRFSELAVSIKAIYFDNVKKNYPFQTYISVFKKSPWLIFFTDKFDVVTNEEIFDQKSTDLKFSKAFLKKMAEYLKN